MSIYLSVYNDSIFVRLRNEKTNSSGKDRFLDKDH